MIHYFDRCTRSHGFTKSHHYPGSKSALTPACNFSALLEQCVHKQGIGLQDGWRGMDGYQALMFRENIRSSYHKLQYVNDILTWVACHCDPSLYAHKNVIKLIRMIFAFLPLDLAVEETLNIVKVVNVSEER